MERDALQDGRVRSGGTCSVPSQNASKSSSDAWCCRSGWTCPGMLGLPALADDQHWFGCVVGGRTLDVVSSDPTVDGSSRPTNAPPL